MILFGLFAITAGCLITLLPETYNRDLPDNIADAVRIQTEANAEEGKSIVQERNGK